MSCPATGRKLHCCAVWKHKPPLARSALGSLSGGAVSPNGLTEGVYPVGCCKPMVSPHPVGVANLATRWHEVPLGFPRGEAAERSEADEGWRQVGQRMQLDEWHMFWFSPLNGEI